MSIHVSIVFSESAFSVAGRILSKNRTSLSPEALEALVCAKDWLIGFNDAEEGNCHISDKYCKANLSDTIKRGTLSKNRKNCLDLINIKAKRQPRGLGRFARGPRRKASADSPIRPRPTPQGLERGTNSPPHPRPHPARPRTRYRFSASPEAPPERPRTRYRFSVSLEAGSASAPPQLSPTSLTERHIQLKHSTTPATSAARRHSTAE